MAEAGKMTAVRGTERHIWHICRSSIYPPAAAQQRHEVGGVASAGGPRPSPCPRGWVNVTRVGAVRRRDAGGVRLHREVPATDWGRTNGGLGERGMSVVRGSSCCGDGAKKSPYCKIHVCTPVGGLGAVQARRQQAPLLHLHTSRTEEKAGREEERGVKNRHTIVKAASPALLI